MTQTTQDASSLKKMSSEEKKKLRQERKNLGKKVKRVQRKIDKNLKKYGTLDKETIRNKQHSIYNKKRGQCKIKRTYPTREKRRAQVAEANKTYRNHQKFATCEERYRLEDKKRKLVVGHKSIDLYNLIAQGVEKSRFTKSGESLLKKISKKGKTGLYKINKIFSMDVAPSRQRLKLIDDRISCLTEEDVNKLPKFKKFFEEYIDKKTMEFKHEFTEKITNQEKKSVEDITKQLREEILVLSGAISSQKKDYTTLSDKYKKSLVDLEFYKKDSEELRKELGKPSFDKYCEQHQEKFEKNAN